MRGSVIVAATGLTLRVMRVMRADYDSNCEHPVEGGVNSEPVTL